MRNVRAANDIGHRFRNEREYIERYVDFLRSKSTVHDRLVLDLNRILRRVQIESLPEREYDRIGEPYTPQEIAELLAGIRRSDPEVYQTILGHEHGMDNIPSFGLDGPAGDYLDRLHEWVDYFLGQLSDDPEEDDEDGMLMLAFNQAASVADVDEEDRIPPDALKSLLSLAMEHARQA